MKVIVLIGHSKAKVARWAKGTLVSAVAAGACYRTWIRLQEWADDVSAAGQGAMGAGLIEALLAEFTGLLSMPVVLWAGMRLSRERGNHVLVLGGAAAWWLIGAHVVQQAVGGFATLLFLALFAVVGGLLSLAEVPRT